MFVLAINLLWKQQKQQYILKCLDFQKQNETKQNKNKKTIEPMLGFFELKQLYFLYQIKAQIRENV